MHCLIRAIREIRGSILFSRRARGGAEKQVARSLKQGAPEGERAAPGGGAVHSQGGTTGSEGGAFGSDGGVAKSEGGAGGSDGELDESDGRVVGSEGGPGESGGGLVESDGKPASFAGNPARFAILPTSSTACHAVTYARLCPFAARRQAIYLILARFPGRCPYTPSAATDDLIGSQSRAGGCAVGQRQRPCPEVSTC